MCHLIAGRGRLLSPDIYPQPCAYLLPLDQASLATASLACPDWQGKTGTSLIAYLSWEPMSSAVADRRRADVDGVEKIVP